jgi:hypothetical protein
VRRRLLGLALAAGRPSCRQAGPTQQAVGSPDAQAVNRHKPLTVEGVVVGCRLSDGPIRDTGKASVSACKPTGERSSSWLEHEREVSNPRAAVILGAGWSVPAGLPTAARLFTGELRTTSQESCRRLSLVQSAYERWASSREQSQPELFLQECYTRQWNPAPWPYVVEYVQARIANPVLGDSRSWSSVRYGQRITNRTYHQGHESFWLTLLMRVSLAGVITTNYDLLAERSLRHREMKRPPLPGFFYAGLPRSIIATGQAQPWTVHDRRDRVALTGRIPLAKLHGSLNWSIQGEQPHQPALANLPDQRLADSVKVYQDVRASFRDGGTAAIVPPIPEKKPPAWLSPVWSAARTLLSEAETWIVVGYSLPEYDYAIRELLSVAGSGVSQIEIHDPYAAQLANRWCALVPQAEIVLLPGVS